MNLAMYVDFTISISAQYTDQVMCMACMHDIADGAVAPSLC